MGENIKVSVVIPVYNAYDYLRPALDSVIDQSLREIEIICVDDGSTDDSPKLLRQYAYVDKRIVVVSNGINAGVSTARNKGLIRAVGEYVIFLDADDFYEPGLLQELYDRARADDLDIVISRFDYYHNKKATFTPGVDEPHGSIYSGGAVASHSEYPDHIFSSTSGFVWNKLFRTAFLKDKGLMFPAEFSVFEDNYFVLSALSLAQRVGRVEQVMVHHRIYYDRSRAKLYRKHYSTLIEMYMRVKTFLMRHGMYVPLTGAFVNTSVEHCYRVFGLLWSDEKQKFWDSLHDGYADSLGWFTQEASEFDSEELADFAANVGIYTYEQYMSRLGSRTMVKGSKLSPKRLLRRIRGAKLWEKLLGRFRKKKI